MTALFWKTAAGILVAAVLILALEKQEKDFALMVSIAACVITGIAVFTILEPILDYLWKLSEFGSFQHSTLEILMKVTGIGMVSELVQLICRDSGNSSLAQGMQFLSTALILLISLPVFETLLTLIQQILGEL